MKKYTKAIAGAMALVSAVTAFSGCSGSGTPAASGATSSSAASTTGETQKQMSKNEGVQSAVDNVSAAEDYKDINLSSGFIIAASCFSTFSASFVPSVRPSLPLTLITCVSHTRAGLP